MAEILTNSAALCRFQESHQKANKDLAHLKKAIREGAPYQALQEEFEEVLGRVAQTEKGIIECQKKIAQLSENELAYFNALMQFRASKKEANQVIKHIIQSAGSILTDPATGYCNM